MNCKNILDKINDGVYSIVYTKKAKEAQLTPAFTPECIDNLKGDLLHYLSAEPQDYGVIDDGLKLTYYKNTNTCNSPYTIEEDGDNIIIGDSGLDRILVFSKNFELINTYYTKIASSSDRSIRALAFTDTHFYIGTHYNRLICINRETKEREWEFGTYNSRGKAEDGKVGHITGIRIMSNGNLLVLSSDGVGSNGKAYGTLEEFKPDGDEDNKGQWVKTHLQYDTTKEGIDYETYNPRALRVYDDTVYVGRSDAVDIFQWLDSELTFIQTVRRPANSTIDNLDLADFTISDDIMYVVSNASKKIIGFNMLTGSVDFSVGAFHHEAYSNFIHQGNAVNQPHGIAVIDGHIYITDISNKQVLEIFRDDFIHPLYTVPDNINILSASHELDENNRASTPVGVQPDNLRIVYKEIIL